MDTVDRDRVVRDLHLLHVIIEGLPLDGVPIGATGDLPVRRGQLIRLPFVRRDMTRLALRGIHLKGHAPGLGPVHMLFGPVRVGPEIRAQHELPYRMNTVIRDRVVRDVFGLAVIDLTRLTAPVHFEILGAGHRSVPVHIQRETVIQE